ncbi:MAG: 3-oxoadipate enol-lactonase [Hyphomicrobiales bacterium]|nr:3-oxoadipate enol-lactonase [Hyphomicrobiales bacterium]
MADVKIGDETFHVVVEGPKDAPALLISNSLGSSVAMWDLQAPALAEHFRVVRYDARGHGESAAPEGPYSIDRLGADALAILDALEIEKAHFMGLSKGGAVGQWLLVNAPERIERAVLANTAAQFGSADVWNERQRIVREQGLEGMAPAVIDRWFTQDFQNSEPEKVAKIREALLATPQHGYLGSIAALRDLDLREAIRAVKAPVLVIVGKHDPATPPEAGRLIAATIPGAKLVELEASHMSAIEAAEDFTAAVLDFLLAPAARKVPKGPFPRRRGQKAAKKARAAKGRPAPRAVVKKAAKKTARKAAKKARKAAAKPPKKTAGPTKAARKAVAKKSAKKAAVKKAARKAPAKRAKKAAPKKAAKKTVARKARKPARKR